MLIPGIGPRWATALSIKEDKNVRARDGKRKITDENKTRLKGEQNLNFKIQSSGPPPLIVKGFAILAF